MSIEGFFGIFSTLLSLGKRDFRNVPPLPVLRFILDQEIRFVMQAIRPAMCRILCMSRKIGSTGTGLLAVREEQIGDFFRKVESKK
jgi:hypothetical protein